MNFHEWIDKMERKYSEWCDSNDAIASCPILRGRPTERSEVREKLALISGSYEQSIEDFYVAANGLEIRYALPIDDFAKGYIEPVYRVDDAQIRGKFLMSPLERMVELKKMVDETAEAFAEYSADADELAFLKSVKHSISLSEDDETSTVLLWMESNPVLGGGIFLCSLGSISDDWAYVRVASSFAEYCQISEATFFLTHSLATSVEALNGRRAEWHPDLSVATEKLIRGKMFVSDTWMKLRR